MKPSRILLLFLIVFAVYHPVVQAMPDTVAQRVIVHTTSPFEKAIFKQNGCAIIHELKDATAIECPEGVFIPNAERDELLQVLDMDADTRINADDVWNLSPSITGKGVVIAVLDTGVDYTHPELTPYVITPELNVNGGIGGGMSFVSGINSFWDDNGHGTHVSGIITADIGNAKGVAPDATVWMAKVCGSDGLCYTSDMAAAIEYIANNQIANVMSISIGGGGTTASACDSDYLASKINWAYSKGVVAAIAAGNDGRLKVSSPACASKAIAVAAVDKSDIRASWSNYGKALQDHGVAAPGVSIYSTVPSNGYESWSGTSMATPHVSALMALLLQKDPGLSPADLRSMIFQSADCLNNKYGACPNIYVGFGRVDAYTAVNSGSTPTQPYLTIDASPTSIIANGTSVITVHTSDNDEAVISFTTSPSYTLNSSSCTTLGGGCSVTFTSSVPGAYTIIASNSGYISDSTTITVISSSTCVKKPKICNCDGTCGPKESNGTCPSDCPTT